MNEGLAGGRSVGEGRGRIILGFLVDLVGEPVQDRQLTAATGGPHIGGEYPEFCASGRSLSDGLKAFFEQNGELIFRLDPFARGPFPILRGIRQDEI